MSRSSQLIGYMKKANQFIEKHLTNRRDQMRVYQDMYEGYAGLSASLTPATYGMFDEWILQEWDYISPDGKEYIVKEKIQAEPWSSGPMYFMTLEFHPVDQSGEPFVPEEYLWPEDCEAYLQSGEYLKMRNLENA